MEMNSVMATEIVAAEVEHIVLPQIVSIKQASRMLGLPPYYLRRLCKEVPGVAFQYKEWWYTKKRLMGASWQRDMVKNKESKRESLMRLAGEEFVIIDDFGWPRNPDGYNALVKRVAKKAGLKDIHPHMFRHTFVSLLMSNPDIGVATVAAEAGHAQPSTTLMIYTQQYKKRRESIRNQLSRELYEK